MKVLDLFSGIGGFSLGLERAGFTTVAFCEIEPFCRAVLKKHWPHVPCYEDVRTLTADRLRADGISVDVICGGFPCQDVSLAGERAGLDGERSGLWAEYARLVSELRPQYVIVENTPGLLSLGMGRVLGDLATVGYDSEWHCIPASYVGLRHLRDRVWIVAYPERNGVQGRQIITPPRCEQTRAEQLARLQQSGAWPTLSVAGAYRDRDGFPDSTHRNKALGNAVVPQIPEMLGRAILASEAA